MSNQATDDTVAVNATVAASQDSRAPVSSEVPRTKTTGSDHADLYPVDPALYAIGDELARGGMGRIIRARDLRLGRGVAIKELLAGHDDARFEREARITARLQHPAIVHVHEAGRWPTGEPFFAMKLVQGRPLDAHISRAADLAARLALIPNVIAVVDALAYAHGERVIHRDLKPANVLCGDFGETVVIDWGLAKDLALDEPDELAVGPYRSSAAREGETVVGAVMGTPAYMPPEQAEGERVDARADVYALGAILYHVLAGAPPYTARNTEDVLERVLAAPPPPIATRIPEAPVELVAIVEKAMARAAGDRFPSAKEMADELKRFQTGQLVTSHRYTVGELVRRWIRKHRGPLAVAAIAVGVLVLVGVASITTIVSESHRADAAATDARRRADIAMLQLAKAALDTDPTQTLVLLAKLSPGAPEWAVARTVAADAMARGVAHVLPSTARAEVKQLAFSLDGARLAVLEPTRVRIWDVATSTPRWRELAVESSTIALGFARSGELIHAAEDGTVLMWNPETGIDRQIHVAFGDGFGFGAVSPNGRWIAFSGFDASLLEVETGALRELGHYGRVLWTSDGTMVAYSRANNGALFRIDPVTLAAKQIAKEYGANDFAASNTRVWGGTYEGVLQDLSTGAKREQGHKGPISSIAVMPDGAVATASSYARYYTRGDLGSVTADRTITVADGTTSDLPTWRGHRADITTLVVAPDGRLASGDLDGEIRIWARTPVSVQPFDQHTATIGLRIDGHTIAIARRGPALEVRDLTTGTSRRLAITAYPPGFEAPSPDSITNRIMDAGGRRFMEVTRGGDDEIVDIERTSDGRHWVTLDDHHHAVVWDLDRGGRMLATDIDQVAISGDGSRVATFGKDELTTWDLRTNTPRSYERPKSVTALALSPDGTRLAVADDHDRVLMLDGERISHVSAAPDGYYNVLRFSPDGTQLACGSARDIHLVDLASNTDHVLKGHSAIITSLQFERDGKRLVSTSVDATARVWSLPSGSSKELRGHTQRVRGVELAGDAAVTTSTDHTVWLWDLAAEIGRPLPGHDDRVAFAMIQPDGRVFAIDRDDRTSLYRDDLPYGELGLRTWLAAATNLTTSDGERSSW